MTGSGGERSLATREVWADRDLVGRGLLLAGPLGMVAHTRGVGSVYRMPPTHFFHLGYFPEAPLGFNYGNRPNAIALKSALLNIPDMNPEPENAKPVEDEPQKFVVTGDDDLADEIITLPQCRIDDPECGSCQ